MSKPIIICMTPVRNEAWVLHAFIKATSLWADYIIIADQMSTDGSREIALSYPRVILIDNPSKEMHQAQTRQLLFDEAQKIKGNKIFFALDADEFLSGDFLQTESWKKIIYSKPGDLFWFKWINLSNPVSKYISGSNWMYWACNIDNNIDDFIFPDNYIHEWRLPYPKSIANDIYIEDISFIHFARVCAIRQKSKERFYQVITKLKEPQTSIINLYRMYNSEALKIRKTVDNSIYKFYKVNGLDLFSEINVFDTGECYTEQVIAYFKKEGLFFFSGLCIWDKAFLNEYGLKDPRSVCMKLIHLYLRETEKYANSIFVKAIDKIFRKTGL